MKTRTIKRAGYLLMGLLALTAGNAFSATCSVTAAGVAFGSYDRFSGAPLDSTGSVTVECTGGGGLLSAETVNYNIQLSTGGSGSYSPRRMSSGANTLTYNLYTTAARSTIWGDGTGGSGTAGGSFNLGRCVLFLLCSNETESRNHTVYGRIPASQNPVPGNYTDTITVTVLY